MNTGKPMHKRTWVDDDRTLEEHKTAFDKVYKERGPAAAASAFPRLHTWAKLCIKNLHCQDTETANAGNALAHDITVTAYDAVVQLNRMLHGIKHGENVFREHGGVWIVQYGNVLRVYPKSENKGLAYMHAIIANGTDEGLTPADLIKKVNPTPVINGAKATTVTNREKEIGGAIGSLQGDDNEIAKNDQREENMGLNTPEAKRGLWGLQQELNQANKQGDKGKVKRINRMFRECGIIEITAPPNIQIIQRSSAKSGSVPINRQTEAMRTAVSKRIQAAMKSLRQTMPRLHAHLKTFPDHAQDEMGV